MAAGGADGQEGNGRVVLRITGASKTFPGTRALIGVDLDVWAGEVHVLVGGNGSGKSTLIKLLAGVERADPGCTIEVGGQAQPDEHWTAERAFAAGVRVVHQNPAVFPDLTVAENIALGHGFPTGPAGKIRWRELRRRTQVLLDRYHIPATPSTPLGALRAADRTRVAIARALQDRDGADGGILLLDEPTAALPDREADHLLAALRRYAAGGQTILYITHRLDEALAIADRVTVLRDGRKVATVRVAELSEARLVELIVGRPLDRVYPDPADSVDEEVVLELAGVAGGPLTGVDLRLHRGEVLGIAGLLGSGRSELLRMVFGTYPMDAGEIRLHGRPVRFAHPAEAMGAGIAYVPEERQADAIFSLLSVRTNLSAARVAEYFRRLAFRHGRERRDAATSIRDFRIHATGDAQLIDTLSGGNQQKVVLARWLRRHPQVMLLDEPTQGVDIATRADIYTVVRRAASAGTAILIVASDFEELAHACDRVAVLRGGRIVASVHPPIDSHRITELANLTEVA